MKYQKTILYGLAISLVLTLTACEAASRDPEVAAQSTAPLEQTEEVSEETTATLPSSLFWDDVVELVNLAGDTTTVYKLDDGRYLDRMDRFFTYDGAETWTCDDGSIWNRKSDATCSSATRQEMNTPARWCFPLILPLPIFVFSNWRGKSTKQGSSSAPICSSFIPGMKSQKMI